ncbi:hypothetical protein Ddye_023172 [Dipteronia dyeriana]|uniref:Glycosyltransferase n=1 Tax=Dipteronia dyeriana TaxID=168575 RepID=A0AAD9TSH8_9ROSI|nr:hypothetical protein Ddye_023172 [Dipteronia dyeriana]
MKKAELIFVPLTGTSHLAPTVAFASHLMDIDDRISITVLLMKVLPFVSSMTESIVASHPRIRFVDVPQLDYPPVQLLRTSPEGYFSVFSEKNIPHVRNFVRDIIVSSDSSSSSSVTGLVVDLLLIPLIDAAIELNLPCYTFSPFSAGFVSLLLTLSTRDDDDHEFQYSDSDLIVPGFVNPVPVSVLVPALLNKDGYIAYLKVSKKLMNVKGMILNTFSELEPNSVNSFSGGQNPTVYTVGPLLHLNGQPNSDLEKADRQKILKWLDYQPETSVVFLCFGTAGNFSPAQVKEMATGLEQSECRFLWSLRVSSPHDRRSTTTNNDDVLPEGFMERIRGRGMICGWAPQVEVLAHKAIGGFVSHCGWNSVLESLWYGVPIVPWPLYSEQQFNALTLVKELGLSVEMRLDSRRKDDGDHIVAADEIARAVRCAMDGVSGIRKKVKEMSEIARKSMLQGGSSFDSITQFIDMNF